MEYRIPPGVEAVEKLEDFIVVNRLAPNTRIPSERDLCEMWGVSRSTLRQAVDALVCRGVLYRISGSGVYVSGGKKNRNMVGVDSMVGELRQQGAILVKKIISCRKRTHHRRMWCIISIHSQAGIQDSVFYIEYIKHHICNKYSQRTKE